VVRGTKGMIQFVTDLEIISKYCQMCSISMNKIDANSDFQQWKGNHKPLYVPGYCGHLRQWRQKLLREQERSISLALLQHNTE
jgi:hypothetical protein